MAPTKVGEWDAVWAGLWGRGVCWVLMARSGGACRRDASAGWAPNGSLRDMGTHVRALPTGGHCPRGMVCLGCGHAQPKKSDLPVFRRMSTSHTRALDTARKHGEPAGQIAF